MFQFTDIRPRRRPGLTPLIDVVFLLLVFFMLASQFGRDTALPLETSGAGAAYSGPPRLVTISPEALALNGISTTQDALPAALESLMDSADDTIILRPADGATVQRLTDIVTHLSEAGYTTLILTEGAP